MKSKSLCIALICSLMLLLDARCIYAIVLDLNDFTPYPPEAISITPDGFAATIYEDETIAPVSLANWSLDIPADAVALSFDFLLEVADNNEDYLDFYIGPSLSFPSFEVGGGPGSYSGSYIYDLTGFQGSTVSVLFDLMFGWEDRGFESHLTVSNVNITPVPEPGTITLLGIALLGLLAYGRRKLNRHNQTLIKKFLF